MDSPEQDVERYATWTEDGPNVPYTDAYWIKHGKLNLCVSAADYDRLQAEVAALKELLRRYGTHDPLCMYVVIGEHGCTCGLDAALARGGHD